MKAKATVKWSPERQRDVRKGLLVLEYDASDRAKLWKLLGRLDEWQKKHGAERELDLTLEVHYKRRTLDQNALLWGLYEIKAHTLNGGRPAGPGLLTAEQLYEQDILRLTKVATVIVPNEYAKWIRDEYRFVVSEELETDAERKETGMTVLKFHISSSHWSIRQMHDWLESLFDELAVMGVEVAKSDDLKQYWKEWRQHVNDSGEEVVVDEVLTGAEYREQHVICEATGVYLISRDEMAKDIHVGDLAHIDAKGMGGDILGLKDSANNFLILDHEVHMKQHAQDWSWFIAEYPHLRRKVEAALGKEVTAFTDEKQHDEGEHEDEEPDTW